jgi:hypothetical protein
MPNSSIDALMPALRAELERAYEHGRADARQELARALGVASVPPAAPVVALRPKRAARGTQIAAVQRALSKQPRRFSEIQRVAGVKKDGALHSILCALVARGVAVKVARGLYALRQTNGHAAS